MKQEVTRRDSTFTPAERVTFVSDTVAFARAKIMSTREILDLIQALNRAGERNCTSGHDLIYKGYILISHKILCLRP
jgi:hypothetical protein